MSIEKINQMTREDMYRAWRFSPPGDPMFRTGTPEQIAFDKRFKELGGFSPEISKKIGWDAP